MSPSKLTKYCACHAKWPSNRSNIWQKFAENSWNVISNARPIRDRSENDPRMNPSVRNPPRNRGYLSRSGEHFVLKNATFRAQAIFPNFTKYCACHEKWHFNFTKYCAYHEKWHLNFTKYCACHEKSLDLHQVLHLPRKVTLDLQVLHLPRKVTLDLHQVLRLPRKVSTIARRFYYLTLLWLSDSITWLYYYSAITQWLYYQRFDYLTLLLLSDSITSTTQRFDYLTLLLLSDSITSITQRFDYLTLLLLSDYSVTLLSAIRLLDSTT